MLGKTVFRRPGAYILAPLFAGKLPALLSHCFLICGMELITQAQNCWEG